jgi:2-methylfumaryl-CoA hydratase
MSYQSKAIIELAPDLPLENHSITKNSYGRYLEDFQQGSVFEHPRGMTLNQGLLHDFATTYLESNPLYLNLEYAKELGYQSIPASPLLVMNIILSLGVQNNSEKAYANLGYYDMHFLKPVYAGDTLRAYSKIAAVKDRGPGKPGIITLDTTGINQNNEIVIQYTRKIMVPPRPEGASSSEISPSSYDPPVAQENPTLQIPTFSYSTVTQSLTGKSTFYEDFSAQQVVLSPNGRTITDEHFAWTYKVGNTHPLHFDKLYSQGQTGAMSGDPIVYGGLIFAWLLGLGGRCVSENSIYDLGYTEGYHTQPAKSGDTIYVIHRVLSKDPIQSEYGAGPIQFQVIGLKNIKPIAALEKYGSDLFIKENNKKGLGKDKIPEKIFEIERRLLIRSRG